MVSLVRAAWLIGALSLLLPPPVYAKTGTGDCFCTDCTNSTVNCALGTSNCEADGGAMGACKDDTTSFSCKGYTCDTEDGGFDCSVICYSANCNYERTCVSDNALDVVCFHEETEIEYRGNRYSLLQLLAGDEPQCTVPHVPSGIRGLRVHTSCGLLRVTDSHLVSTALPLGMGVGVGVDKGMGMGGVVGAGKGADKGVGGEKGAAKAYGAVYRRAGELQPGDLVWGGRGARADVGTEGIMGTEGIEGIAGIMGARATDLAGTGTAGTERTEGSEDSLCEVLSIQRESSPQRYFGLNCLHSDVQADGIYVSTFGDLHLLPATYMYLAGVVLGVKRASAWGDAAYRGGMYVLRAMYVL
ncbi:hypothetical protein B484DRAFT_454619 [Ochromonadaceae sp. CCMP2298]|nr:hypothetical protein B484DRAFT_454619 [Ochromonadaceae sp. CCMP2298]